ncbi:MAG: hypothetical protein FRX49_01019 [Trebouxia sp. A1-2]|nr:MAG: hypothetical protein FRX49_01019 [Trebouxia sp. A1-2]
MGHQPIQRYLTALPAQVSEQAGPPTGLRKLQTGLPIPLGRRSASDSWMPSKNHLDWTHLIEIAAEKYWLEKTPPFPSTVAAQLSQHPVLVAAEQLAYSPDIQPLVPSLLCESAAAQHRTG